MWSYVLLEYKVQTATIVGPPFPAIYEQFSLLHSVDENQH